MDDSIVARLIIKYFTPTRVDYAVSQPWRQTSSQSTLASLSEVSRIMRNAALPLIWSIVYVETMKDWGLLWKRISPESGTHIKAFISFWAIAHLPHLAQDRCEEQGKDLLWYAFQNRRYTFVCQCYSCRKDEDSDLKNPVNVYGNGPDGHGPDPIVDSRETFLQACQDISSTWSKKLQTLYWDATTCFPECVILNIRRIQESKEDSHLNGLEYLWIDFNDSGNKIGPWVERSRRDTFFNEPVWKLGPTTLQGLKFFSLAAPFWPHLLGKAARNGHEGYGSTIPNDQLPPLKSLDSYPLGSGPTNYFKTISSIRPEIFFCASQSAFHCKKLLPSWTHLRCIHIFGQVFLSNESNSWQPLRPTEGPFFRNKFSNPEDKLLGLENIQTKTEYYCSFLRAAIQLRPILDRLYKSKGCRLLSGEDIQEYIVSSKADNSRDEDYIEWNEDWRRTNMQLTGSEIITKKEKNMSPILVDWLQDFDLAEKVAQSFNKGIPHNNQQEQQQDWSPPYPFRHSTFYPGRLYYQPSTCQSSDDNDENNKATIWLDRPNIRGPYSNHLNIEKLPWPSDFNPNIDETYHIRRRQQVIRDQLLPSYIASK